MRTKTSTDLTAESHRLELDGDWNDLGQLQVGYLKAVGLEPGDRLLDIGCGPLRAGIPLIGYLDAGNYYGLEANVDKLSAGLEIELPVSGVSHKLPPDNVRLAEDFDATGFGVNFDMVLAHSLFQHLTLNEIRLCLYETARVTSLGSRFYASIFEASKIAMPADIVANDAHATSFSSAPYHYRIADLEYAAEGLGWKVEPVGEWGHPSGERLVCFRRRTGLPRSPRKPVDAKATMLDRIANRLARRGDKS